MLSLRLGLIALILPFQNLCWAAGGWNSGASDLEKVAWYLTEPSEHRPITYCLKVAPEFPLEKSVIEKTIAGGFEKWFSYIKANDINERLQTAYKLPVNAKYLSPGCTGNEDLRFEIGTTSAQIEAGKSRYRAPLAYSTKRLPLSDLSRAHKLWEKGGYIWVDDLKRGRNLSANNIAIITAEMDLLVTHELGHVFGNGHIKDTVMFEDVSWLIRTIASTDFFIQNDLVLESFKRLAQIDGSRKLYLCERCKTNTFSYPYMLGYTHENRLTADKILRSLFSMPSNLMDDRKRFLEGIKMDGKPCQFFIDPTCPVFSLHSKVELTNEDYDFKLNWSIPSLYNQTFTLHLGRPTRRISIGHGEEVFHYLVSQKLQIVGALRQGMSALVFNAPLEGKRLRVEMQLNTEEGQFSLISEDPSGNLGDWHLMNSEDSTLKAIKTSIPRY